MALVLGVAVLVSGCAAPSAKAKPDVAAEQGAAQPAPAPVAQPLQEKAESGDAGAQYEYALSLTDTDPKAAARWFERAALQGQGEAAYRLGRMEDDPKRAIEWFSMASAMQHAGAQYQLGDAYLHGRGTAKEPGWGLMWFERAARAGDVDGQYALGVALATGMTGAPQREDALVWLSIAKQKGHADVDVLIATLQARLSSQALDRVQDRTEAWTDEPVSEAAGDRATLRFAQYALGRLGFDAGPADGIVGERTIAAIAAFRGDEGLGVGELDRRTLDRLRDRVAALDRQR